MELQSILRPSNREQAPAPLLILLHGLGADERDLMGLAHDLPEEYGIVCVRAPHELDWGGFSWFDLDIETTGRIVDEQQAARSRDQVIDLIKEMQSRVGPSATIIGGFSQGAALSLGVALKRPDLVQGALIMSGAVLPTFVSAAEPAGLSGLKFLVQHGTQDPLLPIEDGRNIRRTLQELGAEFEYHEYPMAHETSSESLHDLALWLGRWVDAPKVKQ